MTDEGRNHAGALLRPGAPGAEASGGRTGEGASEPADGARVVARGLSRRFGAYLALSGLDLEIEPGEVFGLLGANGAGKTTFIRLVTGYLLPSAGRVTVDGLSPGDAARAVQARIGYVPETPRLYNELRVAGFLRFVAGLRGLAGAARRAAVESALVRFRLEDVARRPIGHLSKGFRQRVSLAQAFLHEPSLVIVDEPTSGLDPLQQSEVREVLTGLGGRRTVLLCTHDLDEARRLTSRCAVLQRGERVAVGPTAEILGGDDPLALFRGRPGEAGPGEPPASAGGQRGGQKDGASRGPSATGPAAGTGVAPRTEGAP